CLIAEVGETQGRLAEVTQDRAHLTPRPQQARPLARRVDVLGAHDHEVRRPELPGELPRGVAEYVFQREIVVAVAVTALQPRLALRHAGYGSTAQGRHQLAPLL